MMIFARITLFLSCCLILVSCSRQQPEGLPKLYPLSLTFVQKGKPIEGAIVSLSSSDSQLERWSAGGITNSNGVCEVYTLGRYRGIPQGEFVITVNKTVTEGGPKSEAPKSSVEYVKWKEEHKKELAQRKTFSFIAPQYNSSKTSPLKISITQTTKQETFDLGDAVKIQKVKESKEI